MARELWASSGVEAWRAVRQQMPGIVQELSVPLRKKAESSAPAFDPNETSDDDDDDNDDDGSGGGGGSSSSKPPAARKKRPPPRKPGLAPLDAWVWGALPGAVAARAPRRRATKGELVRLVQWKLTRTWRWPTLLDAAKRCDASLVEAASAQAFALLLGDGGGGGDDAPAAAGGSGGGGGGGDSTTTDDIDYSSGSESGDDKEEAAAAATSPPAAKRARLQPQPAAAAAEPHARAVRAALEALGGLQGVGTATASALLCAADPSGSVPFMGDEALEATANRRPVAGDYRVPNYLRLLAALRSKAAQLRRLDTNDDDALRGGGGDSGGRGRGDGARPAAWSAALVERCLIAAEWRAKLAAPAGPR